ncbi:MAG: hypothetical protein P4L75_04890 [Clostridia bacterium]|nr:hypothetical protein [Clostridia bacterium]MDR3644007.1 hypothetical protein [Clostridia bacterium]
MQPVDIAEIQRLIEKLDGVMSSKLSTDENGELCEIHILADKARAPKQLSRDIQSAIAASTGHNVEHRIISIAQIDDDSVCEQERLRIISIDLSISGDVFKASVTLSYKSDFFTGSASSINAPSGRYTAVAGACLSAVHNYIKASPFCLTDVQKFRIASTEEINVAVCHMSHGKDRILTGTAIVYGDEYGAIVRATLDAVNRALLVLPD